MHTDLLLLNNRLAEKIRIQAEEIEKLKTGGRDVIMTGRNLIRTCLTNPTLHNKHIPLKVHYQYSLNVEIGEPDSPMGDSFTVQKRYRDFLRLKMDLEKKYGNQKDGFIKNLAFPPKLHFAISQKIANQRKITLSSWLNVVVKHEVDCNADFHANPSRSNLQIILPFLTQDFS